MMNNDKDLYFVAVKVFLEDNHGDFLVIKDRFGDWDIPGGRLKEKDFTIPLEEIIERKIREELGTDMRYNLAEPVVLMRHERDEVLSSGVREKKRIFAIGYRALYLGGKITLGNSHEKFEWVGVKDFVPEKYFTGGWLNGVKEYLQKAKSKEIGEDVLDNGLKIGKYRHYSGKEYEVVGIALHEETFEKLVVYRALYGNHNLWVRPLKVFLEKVDINGKLIKRFEYVEE